MPRKRKLDKWVTHFLDRHGRDRYRFRRDGVSLYLPPPGSAEYKQAYQQACNGLTRNPTEGTINDLVHRFYQSVEFRNVSSTWQRTLRQVIESFRNEAGGDLVADYEPRHLNVAIARRMEQREVEGRVIGGTHAAHRFREVMMRLFDFAVNEGMIADNPVKRTTKVKHKAKGYRAWSESDIRKFRERWPLGTKARLALEIMLWTALRRGNAYKLPPPVDGMLMGEAVKTDSAFELPVMPPLQQAIDAMPEGSTAPDCLIINDYGRPFSAAGFGNKMREWCDAAGLPDCTAHGLRKAATVRAANLKASQQSLKALGQWKQDSEVRTYAEKANQNQLAADTLRMIYAAEQAGNIG